MRLTNLNPRWVGIGYPGFVVSENNWASQCGIYSGVSFDCPHCKVQRLAILFSPWINPRNLVVRDAPAVPAGQLVWARTHGDDFHTLSITPSLNFSKAGGIEGSEA